MRWDGSHQFQCKLNSSHQNPTNYNIWSYSTKMPFGALLVGWLVVVARGLYYARHLLTLCKIIAILKPWFYVIWSLSTWGWTANKIVRKYLWINVKLFQTSFFRMRGVLWISQTKWVFVNINTIILILACNVIIIIKTSATPSRVNILYHLVLSSLPHLRFNRNSR